MVYFYAGISFLWLCCLGANVRMLVYIVRNPLLDSWANYVFFALFTLLGLMSGFGLFVYGSIFLSYF